MQMYLSLPQIFYTTGCGLWEKKNKTLGGNNRLSSNIPKWGNKLALDLIFTS